jgi:hypothetical protein
MEFCNNLIFPGYVHVDLLVQASYESELFFISRENYLSASNLTVNLNFNQYRLASDHFELLMILENGFVSCHGPTNLKGESGPGMHKALSSGYFFSRCKTSLGYPSIYSIIIYRSYIYIYIYIYSVHKSVPTSVNYRIIHSH